jgi:hypothetical protein
VTDARHTVMLTGRDLYKKRIISHNYFVKTG